MVDNSENHCLARSDGWLPKEEKTDCMNEATLGAQELFHSGKIGEDSSRLDKRGFLTGTGKVGFDHQTSIDLFLVNKTISTEAFHIVVVVIICVKEQIKGLLGWSEMPHESSPSSCVCLRTDLARHRRAQNRAVALRSSKASHTPRQ